MEGYGIGTYTVTVSLSDLIDDHANWEGEATAIRVGADVRGALDYDGDIDFFRFQAERGQSYQIDVALGTLDDSIVYLYDGDGWLMLTNDDEERPYWEALSSGERYVTVEGYGIGTYTLTVSLSDFIDDHANSERDATAIREGADVRGALDYDGDIDFFRFQAEEGRSYQIDMVLGTLDESIVNLFDSDGQSVGSYYDDRDTSRLSWEAPSSGEFYVAVEGYGIGTYTLTVSLIIDDHGNSEGDATAIRVGADVRGELEYDGNSDFFRFQAEAGRSYRLDVALGTLNNSVVTLYDTDGSILDANDDYGVTYASSLYWEAPSSGERYVLVGGYGIGTYTLTVSLIIDDHGNSEWNATAIRVGADARGELDYYGDIDYFRFQAERGQSYRIDVALGTLDDSIVNLFDSDGWFLDTNDDYGNTYASRLSWEAPSSGERYVAVEGYGIGTYTLTVSLIDDHGNDFESATRLVIGEAVSLELENDDDIDVLVFRARPGTVYVLTLDWEYYSFRESSTERPLLAVYSSNGQEHTRLMGYDFSRISVPSIDLQWQAVTGGDYYIVIGDGNTEGAGAFYVTGEEATEPIASPTPTPRPSTPASSFVSVSAGGSYTCGVRSDGSVACWGKNGLGAATPPVGSFVSVSGGQWHTCGVRSDGSVACWGWDESGQSTPPAGPFDSVSVGGVHTCGLRSNGSVACWGENEDGRATPPAGSFVSVSAGYDHTCGLRSDGSVACWGDNFAGEATPPAGSFLSVSAGSGHTCGVRSEGSVACWGYNGDGRATPPAGSFVSVSAGEGHTCGVRSNGSVACWGYNGDGEATPPAGSFDSVSAGWSHTCGLRSDGSVACWGSDDLGQSTPPAGSFVYVSTGEGHTCGVRSNGSVVCWGYNGYGEGRPPAGSFVYVSAGAIHTCGVRGDGSVACWGFNDFGETTPPAGSFVSVSAGAIHTCGVRSDGSVACWGFNDFGQSTPPAGSFVSVSAGGGQTCGVRSDGSVACWGGQARGLTASDFPG